MKPGQTVMILGAGLSGLLHLLAARVVGATRVIVTDINQQRLEIAKSLGADLVVSAKPAGVIEIDAPVVDDQQIVEAQIQPIVAQPVALAEMTSPADFDMSC
jgi:L-iditol 2-dehydrogenase